MSMCVFVRVGHHDYIVLDQYYYMIKVSSTNIKSDKCDDDNTEVGNKKEKEEGREHWNDHSISFFFFQYGEQPNHSGD